MKQIIRTHASIGLVVLAAIVLVGCNSDEPAVTGTASNTSVKLVPTLAQVEQVVKLDNEDKAVVVAALEDWQKAAAERTAGPYARHRGGMRFVAAVAPSLDNQQLQDMVKFLDEYRAERRKNMRREFHGRHDRGPGEKLVTLLDLSDEQQAAVQAIHRETREKMREQHEALRAGTISKEQMRAEVEALHDAQQEKLAGILTDEQMSQMEALRNEHHTRMIDRRAEDMGEKADEHTEWLAAVLGLSDEQKAAVRAALETSLAERRASLQALRDDTAARDQARMRFHDRHEATVRALEGILTPEQAERLEILRGLHPRKPHGQ